MSQVWGATGSGGRVGSTGMTSVAGPEADGERRDVLDAAGVAVLGACAAWSLITAGAHDGRPEGMLLAVLAVSAGHAAGRIFNEKTARSQCLGGVTMGIGAALTEAVALDPRFGSYVNHDLAEYHVPAHADIPAIDIVFLPELDDKASPLKGKGLGELGICGVGAAVANAIYNACGVRIRDYPLTLDKLLSSPAFGD